MKKLPTILTIVGLVFLFAASFASASIFDDIVDKANQHIAENQTANAKQLLHRAKLENRNDPEIMYKAGLAYYSIGDKKNTDFCFDKVRKSNSAKYINYAAQHYYDLGQSSFNSKNFSTAENHFKRFLVFAPTEAKQTVNDIYNIGMENWNAGYRKTAYQAFKVAHNLDKTSRNTAQIGDQISDLYFNTCARSNKPCLNFLELSHEFSNKHTQESIDMVVALANAGKIPEKHRTALRNFLAKLNVPRAERNKLIAPPPPNYKVYNRGTYHFKLKAGQKTKRWITFPDGVRIGLGSDDLRFKIIYPDGTMEEAWKLKKTPEKYKFKLLAVTDQVIKLRVK